jgi:hypothetical protein
LRTRKTTRWRAQIEIIILNYAGFIKLTIPDCFGQCNRVRASWQAEGKGNVAFFSWHSPSLGGRQGLPPAIACLGVGGSGPGMTVDVAWKDFSDPAHRPGRRERAAGC